MSARSCADRAWCDMGASPDVEHEQYHASDTIELAGSDGSLDRGWWAWLYEDVGKPVMVTIEGVGNRGVVVPAVAVAALLAATATPETRQALLDLLDTAGIDLTAGVEVGP